MFVCLFSQCRQPTSRQRSLSSCCWCCVLEEWPFPVPSVVSNTTFTQTLTGLLIHRYLWAHATVCNCIQEMFWVKRFCFLLVGLDGCRNPNILFVRHMFGLPDYTGELQQVQQQLLQVSFLWYDELKSFYFSGCRSSKECSHQLWTLIYLHPLVFFMTDLYIVPSH